jgi:hypothetical protein
MVVLPGANLCHFSVTITTNRLFDLLSCVFDKQHRDKICKSMKVREASASRFAEASRTMRTKLENTNSNAPRRKRD